MSENSRTLSGAELSDCGAYRYSLLRRWSSGPLVNFIMLNPSTADATKDDPTIRRCIRFAMDWGHPGILVTNLFAFRAADPADLKTWYRGIKSHGGLFNNARLENVSHVMRHATGAAMVICAWGASLPDKMAGQNMRVELEQANIAPMHMGLTKSGEPRHPLYLASTTNPAPWARKP